MAIKDFSLFFLFFILIPFLAVPFIRGKIFNNNISASASYIMSLLVFPGLNAGVLALFYVFFPGQSDYLYIGAVLTSNMIFVIPFLGDIRSQLTAIKKEFKKDFYAKIFIILCFVLVIVIVSTSNLIGADILEYIDIGKVFYAEKSFEYYPVRPHYPVNFFSSHATHPPFFTILLSFCYMLQQSSDHYTIIMLFLSFFSGMVFILFLLIAREKIIYGIVLILFTIMTSSYFVYVLSLPFQIDSFRVCYFLLSFVVLQKFKQVDNFKVLLFLSFSLGCALSTHSSGLLFYIIFTPIFLAWYVESPRKKYGNFILLILFSLLFGGGQYIKNFIELGKPISDDVPVWTLYDFELLQRLDRDMHTAYDKYKKVYKFLRPDTQASGYTYIVFFLLCLLYARKLCRGLLQSFFNIFSYKQKSIPPVIPYVLFISGFFLIVWCSILLDMDLVVKNYRYLMTSYMFVLVSIFLLTKEYIDNKKFIHGITKLLKWIKNKKKYVKRYSKIFLILTILLICFYMINMSSVFSGVLTIKSDRIFKENKKNQSSRLVSYLNDKLDGNKDAVLSFYRTDLWAYLDNPRVYFYLNDEFVDLYKEQSLDKIYERLKKLKIKYIHVGYQIPYIFFQSKFSEFLSDSRYAKISMSGEGFMVYELNENIITTSCLSTVHESGNNLISNSNETIDFSYPIKRNKDYVIEFDTTEGEAHDVQGWAKPFYFRYLINKNSSIKISSHTNDLYPELDTELKVTVMSKSKKPMKIKMKIKEVK